MGDYSDDINTTRVSYLRIQGCVKVFLHKEHSDENLTKTRDRENTGVIRQPEDKSKAASRGSTVDPRPVDPSGRGDDLPVFADASSVASREFL
jgi:hypothetical protein